MIIFRDEIVYEVPSEYFEEVKEYLLILLEEWEKKFSIKIVIEEE